MLSKVLVEHGHDVVIVCAENLAIFPETLTTFFGVDDLPAKDRDFEVRTGVKVVRVPASRYVSGRTFYKAGFDEVVASLAPDILFVHGNDSVVGMRYTRLSRKLSFPVVFDSHMLSIASRNKLASAYRAFYRIIYASKINSRGLKVVRVQDDPYVIEELGIGPENAPYIGFGSDLQLFAPDPDVRASFRFELGLSNDDTVVLYAGKLDESKGGMLLAEALRAKLAGDPVFVIAGRASGERAGDLERCLSASENHVLRLDTQRYPQLPRLYQMADLALYPAQCSLSFYDAQACGLPVIVDDSTPVNTDRVSHGNGFIFERGSAEGLRAAISQYLDMGPEERDTLSQNARSYISSSYSYEDVARRYEELFREIVLSFNKERKR